jgi:hypothetical protein
MNIASRMRNRSYLLCSLILALSSARSSFATTINAASLSASAVQTAINSAQDGDTVVIPGGSATWTTPCNVVGKSITIQGAGIDLTTITRNITSTTTVGLNIDVGGGKFVTISGITFNTVQSAPGIVSINANANGVPTVQFRVHHCKFNCTSTGGGANGRGLMISAAYGLVDHCTFTNTNAQGGQMLSIFMDSSFSTCNTYHTPQFLGDQNSVVIEDCAFNAASRNDGAFDMYVGAKVTFRHNTVDNTFIGWHGFDSQYRSARSFEIYQNTFTFSTNAGVGNNIVVRGGTGVIWGNTFDSHWGSGPNGDGFIALQYQGAGHTFVRPRAFAPSSLWGSITSGPNFVAELGQTVSGSAKIDGNQVGPGKVDQGYPCLDQPGRGSFPVGNPGNWPTKSTGYTDAQYQALDPIYQWNNNVNGHTSSLCGYNVPETANYVKPNRDYYDNVAKPGYTPLVYPHPLIQSDVGGPPAAPKNLTVVPGK